MATRSSPKTEGTPSLPERLRALWEADDDAGAVEFGGEWCRWGTVRGIAESVKDSLERLGLGAGARVGAVLTNAPESVAVLLAVLTSDRCLTVLNPLQPAARLADDLERARPAVLLAPRALWESPGLRERAGRLGITAVTLGRDGVGAVDPPAVPASDAGHLTAAGTAVELSTSGTTGPPKRIPLAYRQLEASVGAAAEAMKPGQRERRPFTGGVAIVTTPMVHIGGLWGVLQALVHARPIVLLDRFTLPAWLEVIRAHRPRIASLPPAAIRALLSADVPPEDLASLRALTSGTTAVPADLVDAVLDRYGIRVLTVYGATEFSGAVAGWSLPDHRDWWPRKRGSVGRAFPGVELRVVSDDGVAVPAGTGGLLAVRAPQAAGQANADGWARTSDRARIDTDGFLFIEGRADDTIIRGGFKIRPATVAEALEAHPAVAEAAVLGLPEPRLGQVPVAVVERAPGAPAVSEDELRAWSRLRLLPYEIPVEIRIVDVLPRGVSQKVSMPDLRALFDER